MATSLIVNGLTRFGYLTEKKLVGNSRQHLVLGTAAAALALKHFLDIVLWAIAYRYLTEFSQLEDLETAIYFSAVTYTSLGYGDIVLTGTLRIMCGIQAMNGILLFGWSTALLFAILQRTYFANESIRTNSGNDESNTDS